MQFLEARSEHFTDIGRLVSSPEELFLVHPSGRYPWDVRQLEKLSEGRLNLTVCLVEGRVAAFANLYNVERGKTAFIGNVVVSKELRGRGIGKALILRMNEICRSEHSAVPHLSAFGFNADAVFLYSSLGFEPYAVEPRQNPNGETVVLINMRHRQKP